METTRKDLGRGPTAATLCVLVALAAFLRFWRLGWQTYWTDESYTIGRIKGSYDYLLSRLSDQGFPPGWYVALRAWCNGWEHFSGNGAWAFSAQVTRALPAILGTLTVPAVYLLARAFVGRRGALLAALLAAVNPFLIYYSRDIKMYAALLLFGVLNVALFLRWMHTRRHALYAPLFLLSGLALTAVHSMGWALVGLELLFLLTQRRVGALLAPLWLLCIGLMAILPVSWYAGQNHYLEKVSTHGSDASLTWITRYTDMSPRTVAGLPTEQLGGFLWPVYPPDHRVQDWFTMPADEEAHLATRSLPWLATAEGCAGAALLAILLLGFVPWWRWMKSARRGWLPNDPGEPGAGGGGRPWWIAAWIAAPTLGLMLTWIPPDSPWFRRVWHGHHIQPIWEPRYLAIVAPAMILWLTVSIMRLPGRWLRWALFAAAVAVGAFFAVMTNNIWYRNPPFQRAADIAAAYAHAGAYDNVAIGNPAVSFLGEIDVASYTLALGQRPDYNERLRPDRNGGVYYRLGAVNNARQLPENAVYTLRFLRNARTDPAVDAVVLTDREGDLPASDLVVSNEIAAQVLGPDWKLVQTERYAWHYEWRPYLFETWRTRVWTRESRSSGRAGAD